MHIIEQLPLGGGAESLLLVLAKNIDRRRFNLTFCCLSWGGHIADSLIDEGFKVFCLKNYRIRFFYKKLMDIVRLIKAERVDVVQTHLISANLWGRIGAFLSGVAVICKTEHGILNEQWRNGPIRNRAYLILDLILDRVTNCIIYVSNAQRRIVEGGKFNPAKHVVIHNAVDESRFRTNKTRDTIRSLNGFSDKDIVVGTVGRLVSHKGHYYLFGAAREVRKKHAGVRLLVIGTGPEKVRLEQLARAYGLDALFLCEREDVPELMKAMDIYVQPSLREAFGIAIPEAMFSGLPVIATGVGGIPEIVKDGETGILLPPGDSGAISNAVISLIENPPLAKSMGESGRRLAATKFGGKRYAKNMMKLYMSFLRRKELQELAVSRMI